MLLGDLLLSQPLSTLSLFDTAIQSVAQSLLEGNDHEVADMVRLFEYLCGMFVYIIFSMHQSNLVCISGVCCCKGKVKVNVDL